MHISERIQVMQESPIRKLAPLADNAKKQGKKVYHLNIGQPDVSTPEQFLDKIRSIDRRVIEYAPSNGMPEMIDSIIKYYSKLGVDYTRDNILVTNGGSEALKFALIAIGDAGDDVLIPQPYYTNYNSFIGSASLNIIPVTTKAEEGFKLPDIKEFEKKLTPRTRAILLSNPGNPTGRVYTEEEINTVIRLALKHNLYIISDEVYRDFVYDGQKHISFTTAGLVQDRVIIVDSMSKRYSACGVRIGCLVSRNTELMKNVLKLCQERLSVPTIEQIGASEFVNVPDEYIRNTVVEYEQRRNVIYDALNRMDGVICEKPGGAFYVIAKLPVDDAEEFAKWLLTDFDVDGETLMVAPAKSFYADSELGLDEVRMSYVINQQDLQKAMNILEKGLIEYKKKNKKFA